MMCDNRKFATTLVSRTGSRRIRPLFANAGAPDRSYHIIRPKALSNAEVTARNTSEYQFVDGLLGVLSQRHEWFDSQLDLDHEPLVFID
jgi:hypothetical protein